MNRRELIKAVVPAALIPTLAVNGETKAAAVAIPPGNYMLFVDHWAVDIEGLCNTPAPEGVNMEVYPVRLRPGQRMEDAIALYKIPPSEEGA